MSHPEVFAAEFSMLDTAKITRKAKVLSLSALHYKRQIRKNNPNLFATVDSKPQAVKHAKVLGELYGLKFTVLTMCPELDRQMGEMLGI